MEQRVELYYSNNGTLDIVSQDSPPPVISYFIIIFCFLCGVSHNLIVTSAVMSNKTLRSSSVHQMSALLSFTCLLDCLTNESVAIGLLFNNVISWCPLSAVLFPLFLLLHAATLALLCAERTFQLLDKPMLTAGGTRLLGGLSAWLYGLLISLPLLAASEVHYFRNRNSCGTIQQNCWAPALYLLGVILCWACHVVYVVVVVRITRKQHLQTSFSPIPVSSPPGHLTASSSARTTLDVTYTRTCSSLVLLYAVLVVPQTLCVAVTLFLQLSLEPDPWLDPRLPRDRQAHSVSTADPELLLTYLRYVYNVAVPVVVLSSDLAVRRQARRIFCCSDNAVSSDDSTVLTRSPSIELKTIKPPSFKTPVLFSTPQGIHLRLAYHDTSSGNSIRLVTQFCDLTDDPDYATGDREDNPGEDWRRPGGERNVRFSSKVEAVSVTDTTFGSDNVPGYSSDTRTVLSPLLVRGSVRHSIENNRTYSKF